VESCPLGYPRLAAFLDSDDNFAVYRRFGYVQARLLLEKQDEMRRLEDRLIDMDEQDKATNSKRLVTREFEPQRELLQTLEQRFLEYGKLLRTAQQLMSFHKPAAFDFTSVSNFMKDKRPVIAEEADWICCKEDLVALRPGREHAWLDAGIERLLRRTHCRVIEAIFCSKDSKEKSEDPSAVYYDRTRIDRLVVCIITFMILVLLVVPIYILYHLVNDIASARAYGICIGVLLIFTLAFSAVLSLFTRARRHEILGAAAAYCAVLVVFLGNVGPATSLVSGA
ncbi:hypothetical protein K402DRAFT_331180, partial [Aulographum hederae CBS 113979]